MSRLLRQSSQLVRLARIPQYAPLRSEIPFSGISRSLRRRTTPLVVYPRFYSTQDPKPPTDGQSKERDKNLDTKEEKKAQSPAPESAERDTDDARTSPSETDPGKQTLPEGWVRLTDAEIKYLLELQHRAPAFQQQFLRNIITGYIANGAPQELRDLIGELRGNPPTLKDTAKVLSILQITKARFENLESQRLERKQRMEEQSGKREEGKEDGKEEDAGEKQSKQDSGPEPQKIFGFLSLSDIMIGLITLFIFVPMIEGMVNSPKEITWQELRRNFLDKGLVERFVVQQGQGQVEVQIDQEAAKAIYGDSETVDPKTKYFFSIGSVDSFEKHLDKAQDELGIPPSERIPVKYGKQTPWMGVLLAFGPTLLLVGLMYWTTKQIGGRGGNMFNFSKSKAKQFNHETAVKVKFSDVAGMDEAKAEIMEFVSFLKQPEKFERLGAKIPRGAILSGPPGTGKTLLAKATAGESGVPFFSVSGSEFVEIFVGVGPSRVRDLFTTARKNAPCIVFIDEIDAIGKSRHESGRMGGGNDEREATLNQILTEMDGFNPREQVVVLAGTNRADILDQALMRPGRFDRHIYIDRPTMKGREEIFRVYLKKIVTKEDTENLVGRLATLTPGFSGADIANVVNEAALTAARMAAETVELQHFELAIERVVAGLERKSLRLGPQERKTVAYHEAGHAICGWYFKDADPLLKVSIIPRGKGALGYAQYLPQDAYLMTMDQLMDRMAMTLGGRVSEELHFSTVTTGASDDFKKVTQMARAMVTEWGMSDKVGPMHFDNDPNRLQKPFAETTAQKIDAEVRRIVDEAYKKCRDLLSEKKSEIGLIAEELLRKEVLTRDDMVRLLGPRPFADNQGFEKYFGGQSGPSSAPPPFPTEETDTPQDAQAPGTGAGTTPSVTSSTKEESI